MGKRDTLIKLYGTAEFVSPPRSVSVGALNFLYSPEGLRRISWHGTELVRAVAWPIRDENWGTYPVQILEEKILDTDGFALRLEFTVGDGRLRCVLRIAAHPAGELCAELKMIPQGGPFATNRAGFTVLHPIRQLSGASLFVTHSDGTQDLTRFPSHIRPDQPVKDIGGFRYDVEGRSVDVLFDGEVFEMEDQRNWSDASFKTYCVPLVHPFTYEITEPIRQSVRCTFGGRGVASSAHATTQPVKVRAVPGHAPEIGLAVEHAWLPDADTPRPDASFVLLRLSPGDKNLPELAAFARAYPAVDLEVVLPDDMDVAQGLNDLAQQVSAVGIRPRHVIALRESYLSSHQPVGPWPDGPAPNDMFEAVRQAFPRARVGGGMLTNFTEVNRYRPDTTKCDYVTHGLTPLVHASDDMSVLETLEALPQIFASTDAFAGRRPYRLGLASIGMRSNPYGAAVAENPTQIRRTMARVDPRHRGLFGAAYAVGVLAAVANSDVEALCLGAPVGPFGLAYAPQLYPQDGFDGAECTLFPLFHIFQAAQVMAGHPRLSVEELPEGVVGCGARQDTRDFLLLANASDTLKSVALEREAAFAVLDTGTFDAAAVSENWFETAVWQRSDRLDLGSFAVAFLTLTRPEREFRQ